VLKNSLTVSHAACASTNPKTLMNFKSTAKLILDMKKFSTVITALMFHPRNQNWQSIRFLVLRNPLIATSRMIDVSQVMNMIVVIATSSATLVSNLKNTCLLAIALFGTIAVFTAPIEFNLTHYSVIIYRVITLKFWHLTLMTRMMVTVA
jgi:hypothetical protein